MIILSIDPGLSGAIAFISQHGAKVFDLPTVELPGEGSVRRRVHGPSLAAIIRENCPATEPVLAVMEDLSAGGRDSSKQTVGSQYRTRGTIECVLEMLRLTVVPVNARTWKRHFGLDAEKGKALELARKLFPELEHELRLAKHHNRAESLLVGMWARAKKT